MSADVERAVSGTDGQSPWVVALGGLLSLELGGKRGARVQEARARASAAEADLALVAWRTVMATRQAVLHLTLADSARRLAAVELAATLEVANLERGRFAESAVPASELYRTEADVEVMRSAAAAAERDLIEARGSLAAALGVPPRSIDSIVVVPASSSACERLDALGMDSLQTVALAARPEIARSLSEYAIAEAQVKLQVAKQYPDLDLGPGFIWDQGVHRWTVALALPGLLAFRNRAPIVESESARAAAGARVLETQESVLRELALAGEGCRGAGVMRAAADSQMATAARNLTRARATYDRGESTKLDGALAGLAVIRAGRAHRDAERDLMLAGWSLEAAAGEWGGTEAARWPDPRDENGEEETPK